MLKKNNKILIFIVFLLSNTISFAQPPVLNVNEQKTSMFETYTSEQDSAFNQAMKISVPPEIRFSNDLRNAKIKARLENALKQGIPLDMALTEMERRYPNLYQPAPVDVVQNQINRMYSQYVPFTRTLGAAGVQIPLQAIGKLLGLVEDTSPLIKYTIDYMMKVQIVIYNPQGIVIAVLADERQQAGSYVYRWNGKNDDGILQAPGDYIGEVRLGTDKYIRKKIDLK